MPLTPSKTRELLASLDHRPRKPLGQNFLIDGNIVRKSIQLADLSTGEHVVEIGPGLGTLTTAMLEQGCHVHAVELDAALAAYLRESLCSAFPSQFDLVEGDAVRHPRAGLAADTGPYKIIANLPYAITSPWLEAVLQDPLADTMVLMMQKEAADRITAKPGTKAFGAISVLIGAAYDKAGVHRVSRSCFYPVPGVDSLLLCLRKKSNPVLLRRQTRDLIRELFTKRRKQVGSLIAGISGIENWLANLQTYNCSRSSRPEEIPVDAWLDLDRLMGNLCESGENPAAS